MVKLLFDVDQKGEKENKPLLSSPWEVSLIPRQRARRLLTSRRREYQPTMLHLNALRRDSAVLSTNVIRMAHCIMMREPRLGPRLHFDGAHDFEAVVFVVTLPGILSRGHVVVS